MIAQVCPACFSGKYESGHCNLCGFRLNEYKAPASALPLNSAIGPYRIGVLKTVSRQSQIYTGVTADTSLPVIIEEFFPQKTVSRAAGNPLVRLANGSVEKEQRFQQACLQIETSLQQRPLKRIDFIRANDTVYGIFERTPGSPVSAQCEALADSPVLFRNSAGQPNMTINLLDIPPMPAQRPFNPGEIENKPLPDNTFHEYEPDAFADMVPPEGKQPGSGNKNKLKIGICIAAAVIVLVSVGIGVFTRIRHRSDADLTQESVSSGISQKETDIPPDAAHPAVSPAVVESLSIQSNVVDILPGTDESSSAPSVMVDESPAGSPAPEPEAIEPAAEPGPDSTESAAEAETDEPSSGPTPEEAGSVDEKKELIENAMRDLAGHLFFRPLAEEPRVWYFDKNQVNPDWHEVDNSPEVPPAVPRGEKLYPLQVVHQSIIGSVGATDYIGILNEDGELLRAILSEGAVFYLVTAEDQFNGDASIKIGAYLELINPANWKKIQDLLEDAPEAMRIIRQNDLFFITKDDQDSDAATSFPFRMAEWDPVPAEQSEEAAPDPAQ